jgi:hypothetical protein
MRFGGKGRTCLKRIVFTSFDLEQHTACFHGKIM